ncbi:MAG: PQQ-binding-like beta-propeller repeat protein [Polyangiaceae bacterium]
MSALVVGVSGLASAGLFVVSASAQRLDPKRPETLVVGAPRGPSPTDRVDGQRSGFSRFPLPNGALRVSWRRAFGQATEFAPLSLADGETAVVVGRGELVILADDGTERWRTLLASTAASTPTQLSDGTVVVVTSGGEAVGVRRGVIRFRTRLSGDRSVGGHVSALSLEDGGVVVATATELTALDADGGVRARASIPEPMATPLVGALGKVIAITATGVVYGWAPGRDPQRLGTFGGPVDGGATLADSHTLIAVVDATRLAVLDLAHGVVVSRAVAPSGAYLGPPSVRGDTAFVLGQSGGRTFTVAIDPSGQEVTRTLVATSPPVLLADGGTATFTPSAHTGTLIDAAGTIAFAGPEGRLGVVTASGTVETLSESLCARSSNASKGLGTIAAIAPASRAHGESGAMLAICDNGGIVKVASGSDGSASP